MELYTTAKGNPDLNSNFIYYIKKVHDNCPQKVRHYLGVLF